jgi:hypothetical protein
MCLPALLRVRFLLGGRLCWWRACFGILHDCSWFVSEVLVDFICTLGLSEAFGGVSYPILSDIDV